MSENNLKLTTAIEAMKNGIASLRARSVRLRADRTKLDAEITVVTDEIRAREDCLAAMVRLQSLFPSDETIKFVVPCGD